MPECRKRPLGEIVRQVTEKIVVGKEPGKPYVGLEHLRTGSPYLCDGAPSESSVSTNTEFEEGDILFGKLRPYLRKSAIATCDGYSSTDILVLRAVEDVDRGFAGRVFQSENVFTAAIRSSIGTRMPRTSWKALRTISAFCPALPAQQRIAEILDTIDDAIRHTEAIIAKLEQVKKGLLHDLLTRGIDDNGELRDPERDPEQFKESSLGWIPRAWHIATIEELLADVTPAMRSGPFGSALLKSELVSSGVPLLGIDNVHVERYVGEYHRYVTPAKAAELSRYAVRPGDVMITIMGTVGRCCVVPDSIGPTLSSKHVWTLTLDRNRYSSYLACLQINHAPWVLGHFARDEQGGIMAAIRSETLRSARLPVPPISEQRQIEKILKSVASRIAAETASISKLKLEKQGLMDDLLTGRVRVTPLLDEAPP